MSAKAWCLLACLHACSSIASGAIGASVWDRLSPVGVQRLLDDVPQGRGKEGLTFAVRLKQVEWKAEQKHRKDGSSYQQSKYHVTLDLFDRIGGRLLFQGEWKLYPSVAHELGSVMDSTDWADYIYNIKLVKNPRSDAGSTQFEVVLPPQPLLTGMHSPPTPAPTAGPISPPAAVGAATPPAVPTAAETAPKCSKCGLAATKWGNMWVHCGEEVRA